MPLVTCVFLLNCISLLTWTYQDIVSLSQNPPNSVPYLYLKICKYPLCSVLLFLSINILGSHCMLGSFLNTEEISINKIDIQLVLEQHRFELYCSTYRVCLFVFQQQQQKKYLFSFYRS